MQSAPTYSRPLPPMLNAALAGATGTTGADVGLPTAVGIFVGEAPGADGMIVGDGEAPGAVGAEPGGSVGKALTDGAKLGMIVRLLVGSTMSAVAVVAGSIAMMAMPSACGNDPSAADGV